MVMAQAKSDIGWPPPAASYSSLSWRLLVAIAVVVVVIAVLVGRLSLLWAPISVLMLSPALTRRQIGGAVGRLAPSSAIRNSSLN